MVLIDALYINGSGGKILLDYLVEELEKKELDIFYLLDARVQNRLPIIKPTNKTLFIKATLLNRFNFYKENCNSFSYVLCFGNLPPLRKLNAKVLTYFHQPLFLKIPKSVGIKARILIYFKTLILNRTKRYTDFFLTQTSYIQDGLVRKYGLNPGRVLILPFYPPMCDNEKPIRQKHTFLYVSSGTAHKNHERLIEAFCKFYEKNKKGKLILTIDDRYRELLHKIAYAQTQGYPIHNLGFIDRSRLSSVYQNSEYLIFPSLAESFGLGLIEAIEQGCKVIASDLPYTYEVCDPSLVFDAESTSSIIEAFEIASTRNLRQSVPLIKNNIQELIRLLSN